MRRAVPAGGAKARVLAQALDAEGHVAASADRQVNVTPAADGSFVASFGLTLKPGHYTVRAGAFPSGEAGSVASTPLDVPDFAGPALAMGRLLVYTAADKPSADPADAYAAFGVLRLRPRFGNVFARGDEIEAVCVIYNAGVDPATGKAALKGRFTFVKDGQPVARGERGRLPDEGRRRLRGPGAPLLVHPRPLRGADQPDGHGHGQAVRAGGAVRDPGVSRAALTAGA